MNDEGTKAVKAFAAIFFATLFLYVTLYGGCMAVRQRGGPWVMFQDKLADGTPVVRIAHHKLLPGEIRDENLEASALTEARRRDVPHDRGGGVTLTFPGEQAPSRFTNAPLMRVFNNPGTNALPYGPVEFLDVTFLPGTVAVDVFGHLIEFIPRTLFIDGREIPWVNGTNIVVPMTGKLPPDQRPKRKS